MKRIHFVIFSLFCLPLVVSAADPKGLQAQKTKRRNARIPAHKRRKQRKERINCIKAMAKKEGQLLNTCAQMIQKHEQFEQIRSLLNDGVNPNMPQTKKLHFTFEGSPLGYAALYGNVELTKLLLSKADPNMRFTWKGRNETAAHMAARGYNWSSINNDLYTRICNGHYAQVLLKLFEHKADMNAGGTEELPFTPIHLVVLQSKVPLKRKKEILQALSCSKADMDKKAYNGLTALELAKSKGKTGMVQYLSEQKNAQHQFVAAFMQRNYKEAAQMLINEQQRRIGSTSNFPVFSYFTDPVILSQYSANTVSICSSGHLSHLANNNNTRTTA